MPPVTLSPFSEVRMLRHVRRAFGLSTKGYIQPFAPTRYSARH
jgi:hypothetical protein